MPPRTLSGMPPGLRTKRENQIFRAGRQVCDMLSDIKAEQRANPGYMENHIRTLNALVDELYYLTANYQEELESYHGSGTPDTSQTEVIQENSDEDDEDSEPEDGESIASAEDDLKMVTDDEEEHEESLNVSLAQHTPDSSAISSL